MSFTPLSFNSPKEGTIPEELKDIPNNISIDKAITAQLAIFATKITKENFESTVEKIHQICAASSEEVYVKFIRRLLLTSSSLIPTNTVSNPVTEQLIKRELESLAAHPNRNVFKRVIFSFDSDLLELFTLDQLFATYQLGEFERIRLTLCLDLDQKYAEDAKNIISSALPGLLHSIKSNQVSLEKLLLILKEIHSEFFSTFDKLLFAYSFSGLSVFAESESNKEVLFKSLEELSEVLTQMPFSTILKAIGPENIIPEKFMNDILALKSANELTDAISLLASEMLCPGSQSLTGAPGELTALTPLSIPEASARGSQFGSIIRKLPFHPSWPDVFQKMSERLPNPLFTEASLSALLSAFDDQTIDAFLDYKWKLPFKVNLFVNLRKLNPQNGSFDLLRTNYLKPIVNDPSFPNLKSSVLYFFNVTKLELDCISMSSAITNIEYKKFLHSIFEEDIRSVPELVALGCVQFSPQSATIDDLFENLMVHLLDETASYYPLIVKDLTRKDLVVAVCSKLFQKNRDLNNLLVLHIVQNGYIQDVLSPLKFEESIGLAVKAVLTGWNGFSDFLRENKPAPAIVLQFLDALAQSAGVSPRVLSLKAIDALLKYVQQQNLTPEQLGTFADVQIRVFQAFPRLINFGNGHDDAILANGDNAPFPADVEEQMKLCYQRMYADQLEIKNVVDMLLKLRDSNVPRDQDVFACMIHSLLDEYRFFPEYPLNALAMTSVLFGSMILYDLLRGPAQSIALKYIKDSCSQPPDSNMFKFAVQALFAFRSRLPEFPNYCLLLSKIEALKRQQQVYQVIDDVIHNRIDNKQEELSPPQAQGQIFKSITAVPMPDVSNPPGSTSNIVIVMNSLADDNVVAKANALKAELSSNMYPWFADYLVTRRAKIESNNQHLYSDLIENIGDPVLLQQLINVTVNEVSSLLNETEETPTVRNHLKNLGSWLGKITVARNRPLKYTCIAVKQILIEAYDLSKLALIIPFVCKVLDETVHSDVFKLPNPWTLGILKVLSELYQFPDLKLNLRFEIEVLCNNMKIKIEDIEPSIIIRSHQVGDIQSNILLESAMANLKIENEREVMFQQGIQDGLQTSQVLQQRLGLANSGSSSALPLSSATGFVGTPTAVHQNLQQHQQHDVSSEINFQHVLGNTCFATNESLKQLFLAVLNKSVRDILPPAVERAVSIAVTTSRALVLKDFATEPDELKLRTSAVTLVCRLSKGLALATCRDPLKESIQSSIHTLAPQLLNIENSPLEELPQAITDNIDLACNIIENAAMEKATKDIEEVLAQSISARRLHKERRPDQPFYTQFLSRYAVSLPEPLGLRPNGVSAQQLQVYESFGKDIVNHSPAAILSQIQPQQVGESHQPLTPNPSAIGLSLQGGQQNVPLTIEQTLGHVQVLIENLIRAINESTAQSLAELSKDPTINMLLTQILSVTLKCVSRDLLILKITQIIINALLNCNGAGFSAEIFVLLLKKICTNSGVAQRDVSGWFIHVADERKFNAKILITLFQSGLLSVPEFDPTLATYINVQDERTYLLAVDIISELFKSDDTVTYLSDFICTIEKLNTIKNVESVSKFLNSLRELPMGLFAEKNIPENHRMEYMFMEWVHLNQRQPGYEDAELAFISQFIETGILSKSPELFFKSAVEISLLYFKNSDSVNDGFRLIDSFSRLINRLLFAIDDTDDARAALFKIALSVVTSLFAEDHAASKESFNERPYFRIFSTLLSEFSISNYDFESEEGEALKQTFYFTIADFLNVYQPLVFPGFTFAWITLISHRLFLPNILELKSPKAQCKFVLLLINLLRFQSSNVKDKHISEVFTVVYKGTLRIFLLLFHDHPEVLVQNHYQLCCEIPSSFTQLRNLVLSSYPANVISPYPFTQGLEVDKVVGISDSPLLSCNPGYDLKSLKKTVDGYLRIPSHQMVKTILNGLRQSVSDDCGIGYSSTSYNVKLINALVLYVGIQAVSDRVPNGPVMDPKSSHFGLLASLYQDGPVELQYHLTHAMCNQLRYPNAHTQWFMHVILHFFSAQTLWNSKKSEVQEVLTRVILERLLCNRPHPWGLLVTFTELLKSTELALSNSSFIKSSPEIEALFQSLMKHMGVSAPPPEATNGVAASSPSLHVAV